MLETLGRMDETLFYWINHAQQNTFFDHLMPYVTGSGNWHVPILLTWFSLLLFGGKRERAAALLVIPLITLSDQTSSNLLKHTFERIRPCNVLPDVHLLVGCSHSFSMPSSHAANFGAAAFHFAIFYPHLAVPLIGLAVTIAYSRVYVGVHYPFDSLVGLMVGLACALVIQGFYRGIGILWRRRRRSPTAAPRATAIVDRNLGSSR